MQYDLNAWQTPDWRRESSLDPRFLIGVCCCLVLVGMLALISWRFRHLSALGARIGSVESKYGKIEAKAAEVNRQRACVLNWERILRGLRYKNRVRPLFCLQWAALQRLIPDSLTFSSVAFSSQQTQIVPEDGEKTSKEGRPKRITVIVSELTLQGFARGPSASEDIAKFSRAIEQDPTWKSLLETARLDAVASAVNSANSTAGQKSFTIFCTYKPIRWFDVPKK